MTTIAPARQILAAFSDNKSISEFSADRSLNGTCTQTALECCVAAIEGRQPAQDRMVAYTRDMARRGWCAANGAATLANVAHYARYVLGKTIATEWDYQEPLSADWLDLLRKQAGVQPILMQVAHGANLVDAQTGARPEAAARGLRYHAIAILGKQEDGYVCADGDNPQVTTRLQIYNRVTLAAAVPCGLLMLAMPPTKPAPPPVVAPPVIDATTRYRAALQAIQAMSTNALKG